MDTLKRFTNNLCGDFNNDKQIQDQEAKGKVTHPKAKHINRIANDKIINLPCDFNGYFIIEESYYEIGNRKNILPHLFLFTLNENNQVVLTSYDLPEGISKEEFKNDKAAVVRIEKYQELYRYAMEINEFQETTEISLGALRRDVSGFVAPQMYIYLDGTELLDYIENKIENLDGCTVHDYSVIKSNEVCVH